MDYKGMRGERREEIDQSFWGGCGDHNRDTNWKRYFMNALSPRLQPWIVHFLVPSEGCTARYDTCFSNRSAMMSDFLFARIN